MTQVFEKERDVTTEGPTAGGERPQRRWRRLLIAAAAIAAVVVVIVLVSGGDDGDGEKLEGSADTPFGLEYPDTWRELNDAELRAAQGAAGGVRRKDGKAFVIVRPEKAARTDYPRFERELDREFEKRFKDFRKGTARVFQVGGQPTFSYTYVREDAGTAHSVFVVPAGRGKSYTLNTIVRAGENEAAKETGEIVASFEVKE